MATPAQNSVVITSVARTAQGSFQGAFAQVPATKLGATAIRTALERSHIDPAKDGAGIGGVWMGMVLTAGAGQAPARQALKAAGLPDQVPAVTVNKVCGSGMRAILSAAQAIQLGDAEIMVAGGMENMSLAPYLLPGAREGLRMGNQPFIDSMVHDGLWDPYNNQHMGNCAELCAREYKFSREAQDAFAIESFKRALQAQKDGRFTSEIAPVTIASKKGEVVVSEDEGPAKVKFDKIPQLKPVFDKNGSVTAANASTINDGASAMVLMSEKTALARGLKPLARIVSYGENAQKPEWFTTAPAGAMRKALRRAGWQAQDVDLFEVNEAFAVVAMAAMKDLSIPHDRLNVWGGGISLGHPIGSSGCRIVVTLVSALHALGKKRGIAGICIGGGEALSIAVELV